jgi:hypothetical protein
MMIEITEDGVIEDWNGEDWVDFHWAEGKIGDKLAIPSGPAQVHLRKLCGDGVIRAIIFDVSPEPEEPKPISPSRWRSEDVDFSGPSHHLVLVSKSDLSHWLKQQKPSPQEPQPAPKRGKVPIIVDYLKEMFPSGVPDPAQYPRKQLLADLRAKDAHLRSLDDATLKRAIDAIRNDPK